MHPGIYQPHDITWCFFAFILFLALAGLTSYLKQQKYPGLPRWAAPSLAVLAALLIVGGGLIRIWDERELRNELHNLPPRSIAKLLLSRRGDRRAIVDPPEVAAVMLEVQSLRYVGAHHSYPMDLFDLTIESGGHLYHYQVGRDSDRPGEYWILERGRSMVGAKGREIGRVQSNQLGPMLERLLGEN